MGEVTFEYKLMFDNTWVYNYASFVEKHCWQKNLPEKKSLVLPHLFSQGSLQHWTLEDGFSAIYNSYVQKVDVRYRIISETEQPYYYIYFDLSETPSVEGFAGAPKDGDGKLYNVYFGMSDADTEFVVHNAQRAHGLQLLIKQEAFDAYFTQSNDSSQNRAALRSLLTQDAFRGRLQMDASLIMSLMQLPRHACNDELDLYYIRGYIYNILSHFLRLLLHPADYHSGNHLSGICRLIEVNEEISKHLESEHPALEDAAKRAAMCATKFKKLFRTAYGTTYHRYHQKVRLQRAKEMFQSADSSITAIVRELGYKNAGHFARLFKEEYSISPKEYQKQFDATY
ncbi:helix-turn-helix domain-containing protein [Chitinophaga lutea]